MLLPTQLIKNILALAIDRIFRDTNNLDQHLDRYLDPLDISLKFCYPSYGCYYTSPIAHQLSSKISKPPLEIAQIIYSELPLSFKLAIAITNDGMFNFTLTETYIQECLNWILTADLTLNFIPHFQNFPTFTHTQYAYARCCSLLRLSKSIEAKPNLHLPELAQVSTQTLVANLIAIAESLTPLSSQLSSPQVIKQCQNLTAIFLELSDRFTISEVFDLQLMQIVKKVIYIMASGYINLSEYL